MDKHDHFESTPPSVYAQQIIMLTTKHQKATAVGPAFQQWLGAKVEECVVDTDTLGTFSGEIERGQNAVACARRKCAWGLNNSGYTLGLANEGSFGPHPHFPFIAVDHEVLYFIDRERNVECHIAHYSEHTNYLSTTLDCPTKLHAFCDRVQFPSHALIIRPNQWQDKRMVFKGLNHWEALEDAFANACSHSSDGKVWVETDMRAHLNPSRMEVIAQAAVIMAKRLSTPCPQCHGPGWGEVGTDTGLPCEQCGLPTPCAKGKHWACPSCDHKVTVPLTTGLDVASPQYCSFCNP